MRTPTSKRQNVETSKRYGCPILATARVGDGWGGMPKLGAAERRHVLRRHGGASLGHATRRHMKATVAVTWFFILTTATFAQSATPVDLATSWGDTYRKRFEGIDKDRVAVSASRCGGTTGCHQGSPTLDDSRILGTEYDSWYAREKGVHFRALRSLADDPRSARMTAILYGPGAKPEDTPQCRACHTLDVPPDLRGVSGFELRDGVSCESCHGRSQDWGGGLHYSKKWRAEMSVEDRTNKGFYDTRDLIRRTEKCLECHLGTETKQVTHTMLAAGHPPLTFELSSDLNGVPKHWKDANSYLSADEGPWFAARVWAVGQAVLLRESMYLLVNTLANAEAVDFAVFECYACHHDLREAKQPSWRQGPALDKSRLGQPAWETSAYAMCRPLVEGFMPDAKPMFDRSADLLNTQLRITGADRSAAHAAASDLAAIADQLAAKLNATRFDRAAALRIVRALLRERDDLAARGYRTAVQVDYALHALSAEGMSTATGGSATRGSASGSSANQSPIHDTLVQLEKLLRTEKDEENPKDYDGLRFAELLKQLESQLPAD